MAQNLTRWMARLLGLVPCALALVAGATRADLIVVCRDGSGDFPTIQQGIDAASDGDTVVVCPGVYSGAEDRNLHFDGKSVTLRAGGGPGSCVIDCLGSGRAFYLTGGETRACVIDGFTIINGYADRGGAIYCQASGPSITNCRIEKNTAFAHYPFFSYGGAIYCCEHSDISLSYCELASNTAMFGGALAFVASDPTIAGCTIADNSTQGPGGGVYCEYHCRPTFVSCTITTNNGFSNGGGICADNSTLVVLRCVLTGNRSGGKGGAIYCVGNAELEVRNCTITGNRANNWQGGGVALSQSNATIANCLIADNRTSYYGGGIYCYSGDLRISGCTIAGNAAGRAGGGLWGAYTSSVLKDCVAWGDAPNEFQAGTEANLAVSFSDVSGGWPGVGNSDVDPDFTDPDGPDDDPDTWQDNDYHLAVNSPCIDAGEADFLLRFQGGDVFDLSDIDGQARVGDGDGDGAAIVDQGSDEYCPEVIRRTLASAESRAKPESARDSSRDLSLEATCLFRGSTDIRYALDETAVVSLRILDAGGRLMTTLVAGECAPGNHEVTWSGSFFDGRRATLGVYFVRFQAGSRVLTRKLLLIR